MDNDHDLNDILQFTIFDGYVRGDPSFSLSLSIAVTIDKRWRIHKNDEDFWPSDFHAHCLGDMRLILNLYTGEVYNKNGRMIDSKIKRKNMIEMYKYLEEVALKEDYIKEKISLKENFVYL